MCRNLFISIFCAVLIIGAGSAWASSEPFSVLALLEQHVTNDTQWGPDQTEDQIGVHVRDTGTNRRRVGLYSFDISSVKVEGAEFANLCFSNLGAGVGPVNVYGVIEELDNLPPRLELTWNKAPGVKNDGSLAVGAPVVLDYNDLTPLLCRFTAPGNQIRASTEPNQALTDFVNSDTDGIITLLFAPNTGSSAILRTVRSTEGGIIGGTYLQGEIVTLPELASKPLPALKATDVPRDLVLSWSPGIFANTHNLYFGTDINDVKGATIAAPLSATVIEGLDANSYDIGRLEFGTTYYWRVDEVSAPPVSTVYDGVVWSFTVESLSYPIAGDMITTTASSSSEGLGPENTVNESGLDVNGLLHGNEAVNTMWLSSETETGPASIEYDLGVVQRLHELWVWNYNDSLESLIGFGFKDVTIQYSVNGSDYTTLGTTHEFTQAFGEPNYAPNTIVNLDGIEARYIKLTANTNWGGILNQYGLSEVRFFYIPMRAWKPNPKDDAADVALDAMLSWMAGREVSEHNVYISTDEQAVIDGNAPLVTISQKSYGPLSLDLGKTYYWRVDEVNNAEPTPVWQGNVWNFTTKDSLIVDDFEVGYDDTDANAVWATWIDGYGNESVNGGLIGNVFPGPYLSTINHSGGHSVPLRYDNTIASYSEATAQVADLPIGITDWTTGNPNTLVIWFRGAAANAANDRPYMKLNNTRLVYGGAAANISSTTWIKWEINLPSLGINLSNISSITIGVERIDSTGGSGTLYLDDIQLTSLD
ncbi:MAG: discoidin domain-containing protein [Sedimentisphaerales bacterium]|nr:discoidin domain-containing protein [Sedimentisphaerales bacterium]